MLFYAIITLMSYGTLLVFFLPILKSPEIYLGLNLNRISFDNFQVVPSTVKNNLAKHQVAIKLLARSDPVYKVFSLNRKT